MSKSMYARRLQVFLQQFKGNNAFMTCGVKEFRVISADEKYHKTEFEVTPEMVNPFQVLHGGCTATLLDVGCSSTAYIRGTTVLSLDATVSYLSPASLGETLTMDIELVKLGKTQVFTRGEIIRKRDGGMVAFGTCTYTIPQNFNMESHSQLKATIERISQME